MAGAGPFLDEPAGGGAADADVDAVSILGEKLAVIRPDAAVPDNFNAPGRPVALISNVTLTYRPAPARRPARGR